MNKEKQTEEYNSFIEYWNDKKHFFTNKGIPEEIVSLIWSDSERNHQVKEFNKILSNLF